MDWYVGARPTLDQEILRFLHLQSITSNLVTIRQYVRMVIRFLLLWGKMLMDDESYVLEEKMERFFQTFVI